MENFRRHMQSVQAETSSATESPFNHPRIWDNAVDAIIRCVANTPKGKLIKYGVFADLIFQNVPESHALRYTSAEDINVPQHAAFTRAQRTLEKYYSMSLTNSQQIGYIVDNSAGKVSGSTRHMKKTQRQAVRAVVKLFGVNPQELTDRERLQAVINGAVAAHVVKDTNIALHKKTVNKMLSMEATGVDAFRDQEAFLKETLKKQCPQ
jgi:hypothetical protein